MVFYYDFTKKKKLFLSHVTYYGKFITVFEIEFLGSLHQTWLFQSAASLVDDISRSHTSILHVFFLIKVNLWYDIMEGIGIFTIISRREQL